METTADICEVCGNEYDKCMQIVTNERTHVFDSFECAIQRLAPRCDGCGCTIIGHGFETASGKGTEANPRYFCSAHCANATEARTVMRDRA